MKALAALLTATIVAFWITAIAILSIQNITPVSLTFLTFRSIQLPVGVLLAFSGGIGWAVGAVMPQLLWPRKSPRRRPLRQPTDAFEDF